jgi:hypothetical protein
VAGWRPEDVAAHLSLSLYTVRGDVKDSDMTDLVSIGEFSLIRQLSVKTPWYYHDVGLTYER